VVLSLCPPHGELVGSHPSFFRFVSSRLKVDSPPARPSWHVPFTHQLSVICLSKFSDNTPRTKIFGCGRGSGR
jgi:hypothetical protein